MTYKNNMYKIQNKEYKFRKIVYFCFKKNEYMMPDNTELIQSLQREIEGLRAEIKNGQTASKYESLFTNSPLGILTVTRDGTIVDINQRLVEILGSPTAAATRQINLLTFPPLIKAGLSLKLQESISSRKNCTGEGYYTSKWGKELFFRYTISPILSQISSPSFLNQKNDFELLQVVITDLTDFLAANTLLETREKTLIKLSAAVEQSANVIFITDTEGLIEYVNPKFTEVSGYKFEEVKGKNYREFKSNIHEAEFYKNLWETITSGKTWIGEFQNRTKSGEIYFEHTVISPIFDKHKEIINYVAIKENITALKESQNRLKSLLNNSPDAIFFKDGEGRWLEANNVGLKLFRLDGQEYRCKTDTELAKLVPEFAEVFKACAESDKVTWNRGTPTNTLEYIPTTDGKTLIYEVIKVPLFNADGSRRLLVITGRDSTERETAAEIMQKKNDEYYALYEEHKNQNEVLTNAIVRAEQSDRLKNEFLHNMSHEIRTPLNGILGFSQLLTMQDITEDKRKGYVGIIQNSGKQLLRIIDDILEVSRLETKQTEVIIRPFNINLMLMRLFAQFDITSREKKIPLYLNKTLEDHLAVIESDEDKLSKILTHVLDNAFKFTHTGYVELGYVINGSMIEFYVRDTGVGIKKEKQHVIFERFAQEEDQLSRTYGGLGLGLSIALEHAKLLRGDISFVSEKGQGSTFFVAVPHLTNFDDFESEFESSKPEQNSVVDRVILIAEDEEINFLYLEALLSELKPTLKLKHVRDGRDAINYIELNNPCDVVLMDIKMPHVNGYEATKAIKSLNPNLPVIMQTAYSSGDDRLRAHLAGADDFISKPIDSQELITLIYKYLPNLKNLTHTNLK